jgi:hypothetical protein
MSLIVVGRANKQIAAELDLSEMTVKVHRGQVMRKMRASSLPALVRMADRLAGSRDWLQPCARLASPCWTSLSPDSLRSPT